MKRLVFLLGLFCCCCAPVPATEYYITEAQLQTLETICQNYKKSNLTLQKQVDELQQKVTILKTDSLTLETQLKAEREITQTLNQSLKKYEDKNCESEAEKMTLLQQIAELKIKVQKMRYYSVTITTLLVLTILAAAFVVYKKITR